jgi:hypothetical protein
MIYHPYRGWVSLGYKYLVSWIGGDFAASATSVTDRTQKLPKNLLSKQTDMTIHWKALGEHVLMVPLVVQYYELFNHFWWKDAFSEFFSNNPSS